MRPLLVTFSFLLLSIAGCVSPSEVAPAAETSPSQQPSLPRDPEPAAQEPPPAYAAAREEPAGAPPSGPVERALDLAWEGTTRGFLCVRTPAPFCGTALPGDGTERYVPAFEGAPARLHVTLAWDATSPLTEELVLHVEGVADCDHACHVRGPSPLELRLDALPLEEDWELTLHAFAPCQVCEGHEHMMDPGQAFAISGTLVYLPYA